MVTKLSGMAPGHSPSTSLGENHRRVMARSLWFWTMTCPGPTASERSIHATSLFCVAALHARVLTQIAQAITSVRAGDRFARCVACKALFRSLLFIVEDAFTAWALDDFLADLQFVIDLWRDHHITACACAVTCGDDDASWQACADEFVACDGCAGFGEVVFELCAVFFEFCDAFFGRFRIFLDDFTLCGELFF